MPPVETIFPYFHTQDFIDLGVGSIPCRFSKEEFASAISQLDLSSAGQYGPHEGNEDLRSLIAQEQGIPPEWVIITNGGSEAIALVYLALGFGKRILVPSIHFPAYRELARKFRLKTKYYPTGKSEELCMPEILPFINRSVDLVIINSPLNPSGTIISPDNIREILSIGSSTNSFILLDKTYDFLLWDSDSKIWVNCNFYREYPQLIVLGSLCKELGLAGLRLGYLITCNSDLRNEIIQLKMHLSMCTSVISQNLGLFLLRCLTPEVKFRYISNIRKACKAIYDELNKQRFCGFFPKGGPFIICKTPDGSDASVLLKKVGILSLSLMVFGGSKNKARLCCARDPDIVSEAVKRLSMIDLIREE